MFVVCVRGGESGKNSEIFPGNFSDFIIKNDVVNESETLQIYQVIRLLTSGSVL